MRLEGQLTQELVRALRKKLPNSVVFKHADGITYGIPDISVTWLGSTTWLEVKRGRVEGRIIQNRTLQNLEEQGNAFYILYVASGDIHMISPNYRRTLRTFKTHEEVTQHIKELHAQIRQTTSLS